MSDLIERLNVIKWIQQGGLDEDDRKTIDEAINILEAAERRIRQLESGIQDIGETLDLVSTERDGLIKRNKRLDAALAEIIEHYLDAEAGDCAMDICATMLYSIAMKARENEK